MRLTVCGLGYVGSVTAACMAKAGHIVVGVDVNVEKVRTINAGVPPVLEEGLPELFAEGVSARRLSATTDLAAAVNRTDATLIAVGTPSRPNGSLDTCALESVCEQMGDALRDRNSPHTLVIRSTVLPGTTRGLLIPILEAAAGRPSGDTFGVVYNPEFMREGTSVRDFYTPPFTILGSDDARHLAVAEELYAPVDAPMRATSFEVAEMLKYSCNAFHALKATFANEIGDFAAEHGVDGREVMSLLCEDTKLNISTSYLKPGFAFGGSCLPKDLRALLYRARQKDMELPLLDSLLKSNRNQLQRGLDMITSCGKARIGLLGLTFKSGTDDLRESPNVDLAEALIGKGYEVRIHDDNVSAARLVGANERYIQGRLPHFAKLLAPMQDVMNNSDVLVVCVNDDRYAAVINESRDDQAVVDLVGLKGLSVQTRVKGIAW